ncbi:hypothetical protein [Stygiolobus caldivivus]|uniref:Uncharacterized protein n=1 Tax=Stygiolobus caldivivus TaxID=2824673 RepID=A0A8D5U5E9_9CREN|nr:hypothetical protein [Stygiolobus caldivivus]BCU69234.1 hypothetical protein KN1_05310 [Stygiolobus caldivivus]
MEKFRELIVDLALSKEINNYEEILEEGRKKRDSCVYLIDNTCSRYIIKKDSILVEWIDKNHRATPHPLLCYICPYYSIREEDKRDVLDIFDLYLYYENEKEAVERELLFLDRRYDENPFQLPVKRRREDLIIFLEDINQKINIIKRVIKMESNDVKDISTKDEGSTV